MVESRCWKTDTGKCRLKSSIEATNILIEVKISCPSCKGLGFNKSLVEITKTKGCVSCILCAAEFPVIEGIPILLKAPEARNACLSSRLVSDEHIKFETHATKKVATLVSEYSRGISLDVGCGKGPYLEYFRGDVVLVDINHYFVSEAIARYQGSRKIYGIVADIRDLPFPLASFDFILVSEVLEHLNDLDLRSTIESLKSLTRKYLQVDVPNESSIMHLLSWIAVSAGVYRKQVHDDDALEHHVRIDSRTLVEHGLTAKGCINAVSRNRIKLGPIWDLYDHLVWNAPHLAGTLIGLYVKTDEKA